MLNKHYKEIKKLIKKNKYPDTFSGKYSFSPYMACSHACKYCDGRYEKYCVNGDFEKDIVIRRNTPDLLVAELPKLREYGQISISSGVSDAYQHLEKSEKITQRCAEILAERNFPVNILTKSSLVMRDLELWHKVSMRKGFTLRMSLTYADDKYRKIFEPGASPVKARLETLKEFKRQGMNTGVLAMPFIPYITDTEKNYLKLFEQLEDIDLDFVLIGSMTLKKGRQKEVFLETIQKHFPNLYGKLSLLYNQNHWAGEPKQDYGKKFFREIYTSALDFKMYSRVPHHIYQGRYAAYDEINLLFTDLIEIYFYRGIEVRRLKEALKKYNLWLDTQKSFISRRRNLSYDEIEEKLKVMLSDGSFLEVIKNDKMNTFFKETIISKKIFDFKTLKLDK